MKNVLTLLVLVSVLLSQTQINAAEKNSSPRLSPLCVDVMARTSTLMEKSASYMDQQKKECFTDSPKPICSHLEVAIANINSAIEMWNDEIISHCNLARFNND